MLARTGHADGPSATKMLPRWETTRCPPVAASRRHEPSQATWLFWSLLPWPARASTGHRDLRVSPLCASHRVRRRRRRADHETVPYDDDAVGQLSGADRCEFVSQLRQRKQPPLHLVRIRGIACPDAGFQLIEAVALSLDEAGPFLALTLSQGAQDGSLRVDGALEAQAACDSRIGLAGVAQRQGLLIGVAIGSGP